MNRCIAIFLAIVALVLLSSCASDPSRGYSFASTIPGSGQTIAVDVFDNYTFSKGVEVELTEAIIKEIELKTPLLHKPQ